MPLKSVTCGRELEAGLRRRPGSNNVTFDGKPLDGVFVMHSRSLSLSFRMESTADGSRIHALPNSQELKTSSSGLITPKAGWSIRLSQSKVVWWTRPGSNRRPPHCERGITKAKTRRHHQLAF